MKLSSRIRERIRRSRSRTTAPSSRISRSNLTREGRQLRASHSFPKQGRIFKNASLFSFARRISHEKARDGTKRNLKLKRRSNTSPPSEQQSVSSFRFPGFLCLFVPFCGVKKFSRLAAREALQPTHKRLEPFHAT